MDSIHVEIELINAGDQACVRRGHMRPVEARNISVNACVAKKALTTGITEKIQQVLQLPVVGKQLVRLTNNEVMECLKVGPLEVRFGESLTICSALVLPDEEEPLLGLIAVWGMRLIIDPLTQQLIPDPRPLRLPTMRPAI
jgi:hypothetical protein